MDGDRFDTLARSLVDGTTRRSVLRSLVGGAAGLLSLGGATRAPGQICRQAGSACTKDANCCSGHCDTRNPDPFKRNKCVCPPGTEECRGACKNAATDYLNDVDNCGRCGNRCPADQCKRAICVQSVCGLEPDPKRIGKSCNDGNCCTTGDVCQVNGTCLGTPVTCRAPQVCEEPGVCNPATCQCDFAFKPSSVVCRPAAGPCDVVEHCTGNSPTCPADTFQPASVVCRPAAGECDIAETCPGDGPDCPADGFRPLNFPCGAGPSCSEGIQHAQDTCNGSGTCTPGANTSCGLYTCGEIACRTTCGADKECVAAAFCHESDQCVPDLPNGQPCDRAAMCQTGRCNEVSDICCSQSCPSGVGCHGPGFTCGCADDGECPAGQFCTTGNLCQNDLPSGQPCDRPEMCQSGICNEVNDVCCAERCDPGVPCTGPGFTCCTDTTTTCSTADCGKTITDLCGRPIVCPDCERTFSFTGGTQTWVVPSGVTTATFDAYGAQGGIGSTGRAGGSGGRATATFAITVAQYQIMVGGAGGAGGNFTGGVAGFNGGGAGLGSFHRGGGGGGASDARTGAALGDRILVAGGGGGGAVTGNGGAGGGETGGNGTGDFIGGGDGGGGTQNGGGAGGNALGGMPRLGSPGVLGVGGAGAGPSSSGGGGGGGGYYGGGGGGGQGGGGSQIGGGSGGGSGFIHASGANGAFETGVRSGNGQVLIRYRFD